MTKYLPPTPPTTPPELLETCGKSSRETSVRTGYWSPSPPVPELPLLTRNSSSSERNTRGGFPSAAAPPGLPVSFLPVPQETELYKKLVSCGSLAEYIQLVASSYTAREAAETIKSVERTFLERISPKDSNLTRHKSLIESPITHKSTFYSPLSVKTSDFWQEREQYLRSCFLSPYSHVYPSADKSVSSSSTEQKINYHLSSIPLLQTARPMGSAMDLRVGKSQEEKQEQKSTSGFFRPWEKGKPEIHSFSSSFNLFSK